MLVGAHVLIAKVSMEDDGKGKIKEQTLIIKLKIKFKINRSSSEYGQTSKSSLRKIDNKSTQILPFETCYFDCNKKEAYLCLLVYAVSDLLRVRNVKNLFFF